MERDGAKQTTPRNSLHRVHGAPRSTWRRETAEKQQEAPSSVLPAGTHNRGRRGSHLRPDVTRRRPGPPYLPRTRAPLRAAEPAPGRSKVCLRLSRCTPQKRAARAPPPPAPKARPRPRAWKPAPPRAAVAAACGLLSLSHGQVTQRGAAAATAAAAAAPSRARLHPFRRGPALLENSAPLLAPCVRRLGSARLIR